MFCLKKTYLLICLFTYLYVYMQSCRISAKRGGSDAAGQYGKLNAANNPPDTKFYALMA